MSPARLRPVRSFVLRAGRLTKAQARAFDALWPRLGVAWQPGGPLDLTALFGNENPVYLDIGFGDGEALAEMAARHPERNYLGIEVHRPGVGHLLLAIDGRGLANVRILCQDAVEFLAQGLAPASLAGVSLFFPDPWPKKRHHKRRILTAERVTLLARVLAPGGVFHAATDWAPYAREMLTLLDAAGDLFENAAGPGSFAPRPEERPITRFERRGVRLGHPVFDLVLRRR